MAHPEFIQEHNIGNRKYEVDGAGDVEIMTAGYDGIDHSITLSITELTEMLKQAKAHYHAYEAFKATDYEQPQIYDQVKKMML